MTTVISSDGINPVQYPEIHNGLFWPGLSCAAFLARHRLSGAVAPERLADAITGARLAVNRELDAWRQEQVAAGVEQLEQLAGADEGQETGLVVLYRRAVYSEAKARLVEAHRDYDSTGEGHRRADSLDLGVDDLRQARRESIRAILGLPRATVELI